MLRWFALLCAATIASASAIVGCHSEWQEADGDTAALSTPDRSWVRLDGTVVRVTDSSFDLDFGDGVITVEMDDWDRKKEGKFIHPDDKVIVYGRIDSDLHRRKAVEAAGVYVENLGTTFFASAADEEAIGPWPQTNVELGKLAMSGRIASISGRLLELDTGAGGKVTIDVGKLGYDPFDQEGYRQLRLGDRIRVIGKIESAYFAANTLVAERIVHSHQVGLSPRGSEQDR